MAIVNIVVAQAGIAEGTFYAYFKDRAAFVDSMHALPRPGRGYRLPASRRAMKRFLGT
jgi:hypothetical protein